MQKSNKKNSVRKKGKISFQWRNYIISLFLLLDKMLLKGYEYLKYLSGQITRCFSTKPE